MKVSARNMLIGLGLAFAVYLAARGMMWTEPVAMPVVMVIVSLLLVAVTVLVLFAEPRIPVEASDAPLTAGSRGPTVLPMWPAVLVIVAAAVVPTAVALAAGPEHRHSAYATAYIGAIGAILTIMTVRRRAGSAWIGAGLLTIGAMYWMGPMAALTQGLTGSVMWIVTAQMLLRSLDRAARDTVRLVELQQAAVAWQTAQETRRRERRRRVQFALQVAGPVLTRVIDTAGEISDSDRTEALVAEGSLRDELRGATLMDDAVRRELDAARRRGMSVTLFDEGGLAGLDDTTLAGIRAELAGIIRAARSSRLIIRTVRGGDIAVTIVGRTDVADGPGDDDDVDLWQEIRRDRPAPVASLAPISAVAVRPRFAARVPFSRKRGAGDN